MIFGHTFPRFADNRQKIKPICAFTPIENDDEWRKAVRSLYPIDKLMKDHDMTEEAYLKFESVIDEKQYETLFNEHNTISYVQGKLK